MAFSKLASVPRARTQSSSSDGGNLGGLSQISAENPRSRPQPPGLKGDRPPEQWEQWKVQDQGVKIFLDFRKIVFNSNTGCP